MKSDIDWLDCRQEAAPRFFQSAWGNRGSEWGALVDLSRGRAHRL